MNTYRVTVVTHTVNPVDSEYFDYFTVKAERMDREDVEKSGMGYWPLMRKRQLEIDHERHLQFGEKGNGFEYKKMWFRKERYNK